MTVRVVALPAAQHLRWPWDGSPRLTIPAPSPKVWGRDLSVDAFPCYAHSIKLVRSEAVRVAATFPFKEPVLIAVLDRETPERTNGHCEISYDYSADTKPHPWGASIVLWGKRIPPHPAMTRYLVAHEYGHAVAKAVSAARHGDGKRDDTTDALYKEYRQLRGLGRAPRYYGGLTWHRSTAEVFANDYRLLVAESEPEFWPHQGIPRPEDVAAVKRFWKEVA